MTYILHLQRQRWWMPLEFKAQVSQSILAAVTEYDRLKNTEKLKFWRLQSPGWRCWWLSVWGRPASQFTDSQLALAESSCGRSKGVLWGLFFEGTFPFPGVLPSLPHHLPTTLPSNTIRSGIRMSACELGGKHTHSVYSNRYVWWQRRGAHIHCT